ncbi:MAG: NADH-quinone oxidoreductase subunit C [Oscillochloris sp.]|nr:NADH-quinone oxidoreductase subunit C [Oscillochloris sp.]
MPAHSPADLRALLARDLPGSVREPEPLTVANPPTHGPQPGPLISDDPLVAADRIVEVMRYMRDTLGYAFLSDMAVTDYLAGGVFELLYRLYHPDGGSDVSLRVRLPRHQPQVPSLTPHWPGANFHEREAFDLFGIVFIGHPDLRRIYMWDEFEGFPMRKDFPKQGDKYIGEEGD